MTWLKHHEWLPATVAAIAFAGVAVLFARETFAFRAAVLSWASHDLESRTRLAVEALRDPLGRGDFEAIRHYSDACAEEGIRLSVFGKPRGLVFDSLGRAEAARREGDFLFGPEVDAGAFAVRLAIPSERVLASFRRARVSFVLAALLGMTGVLLFFVVIWRQRMRLRELARLERFRREFIQDVSHEIRTPLAGILGAADLLGGEESKSEVEGGSRGGREGVLVSMIKKESKRLNGLVQSILDLARLERETDAIHPVETDLVALVRETVETMRPTAEMAGVALTFESSVPSVRARVDPQLVAQALSNLITNAIRHSGSPDVAVTLSAERDRARIAVTDHGVGIPPEQASRIFERFYRVDPARAAETGGAGLGLAIVRRIARLHGGDVSCEPVRPHGSTFRLTVPK